MICRKKLTRALQIIGFPVQMVTFISQVLPRPLSAEDSAKRTRDFVTIDAKQTNPQTRRHPRRSMKNQKLPQYYSPLVQIFLMRAKHPFPHPPRSVWRNQCLSDGEARTFHLFLSASFLILPPQESSPSPRAASSVSGHISPVPVNKLRA